jgi:cytochrome c biogenesis protein CcmG, thiol:disulfide interchange protein DsbE
VRLIDGGVRRFSSNQGDFMSSRLSIVRTLSALLTGAALTLNLAACGGGAASGGGAEGASEAGGLVGKPAPEFTAEPVTGEGPATIKDASGRVTIVDFWATFCGPCKKSFPKYQEMVDQFGGDLTVIAVSVDEPDSTDKAKIEEFVKATGVKFAVVWDKDHKAADTYKPAKMPTSYIIDKGGVVRHVHAGYGEGEEEQMAEEIKALIGGS